MLQSVKFEEAIQGENQGKRPREKSFVGDAAAVDLSQHQQSPEKQDLSRGLTSKASGPMVSGEQDPSAIWGLGLATPPYCDSVSLRNTAPCALHHQTALCLLPVRTTADQPCTMSRNPCCLPHLDRFTLQTTAYSKVLNFCYLRCRTHASACIWSTVVDGLARVPPFPEVSGAGCLPARATPGHLLGWT